MSYTISDIAKILRIPSVDSGAVIQDLSHDTRKISRPETALFFALSSDRRDGHDFISEAYDAGVRAFVVSRPVDVAAFPQAIFLPVPDTLAALQNLAAHHRAQFSIPILGITGSNGKTMVKEWLYQLLTPDFSIIRSPRSFNSQLGVPLSVWGMNETHTLGIFEAGISRPGEMEKLARIIRPTIGVLTHLGAAHDEGFISRGQKETEKRKLFEGAVLPEPVALADRSIADGQTRLVASDGDAILIPFTDEASIQNALTCWSVMRLLSYDLDTIADRMQVLQPVRMRLEIKRGIQQCLIVNDAYSLDLDSLSIALSYLQQQAVGLDKTAILTDLPEGDAAQYDLLIDLLTRQGLKRLIAIGPAFQAYFHTHPLAHPSALTVQCYPDRQAFEDHFSAHQYFREAILIKGARSFQLEKLLPLLEAQLHQSRLEIDLAALRHNIRSYQSVLNNSTRIMAMVKSFAYGSGGVELARVMQEEGIAYLGVAYADEGVALRAGGIHLPILVMNTESTAFDSILEHRLEPVLYSIESLRSFQQFLRTQGESNYPVHIELETGMHRLGISESEMEALEAALQSDETLRIQSVFSHLASGEDPASDEFSAGQFQKLQAGAVRIRRVSAHPFLVHLANSAAAIRKPHWQLDMVRIGIGLYGIDPAVSEQVALKPVARLLATIAQVQQLHSGDSVSYNRRAVVDRPTRVATLRLGYADGYPRCLGNGVGSVIVQGQKAPVLGSVCMDMFMVDVTDIPAVQSGDSAILFGPELPLTQLAQWADTIPYEIMTGISQRVKRVYVEES